MVELETSRMELARLHKITCFIPFLRCLRSYEPGFVDSVPEFKRYFVSHGGSPTRRAPNVEQLIEKLMETEPSRFSRTETFRDKILNDGNRYYTWHGLFTEVEGLGIFVEEGKREELSSGSYRKFDAGHRIRVFNGRTLLNKLQCDDKLPGDVTREAYNSINFEVKLYEDSQREEDLEFFRSLLKKVDRLSAKHARRGEVHEKVFIPRGLVDTAFFYRHESFEFRLDDYVARFSARFKHIGDRLPLGDSYIPHPYQNPEPILSLGVLKGEKLKTLIIDTYEGTTYGEVLEEGFVKSAPQDIVDSFFEICDNVGI